MKRCPPLLAHLTLTLLLAACGSSALLGPEAAQGVEGLVLRGPVCPVQTQEEECADQPHQAWIEILDADGDRVTRVRSDEDGRFRVGLAPGRYTLRPEGGDPFPTASDQGADVVAGAFTQVTVLFDTGIR